ncbi:flagellin [Methanolobus chelungpuianus]|uniref:Flagellar protein G n=1 Tax=Methanolobus chelungpuianus TaxID=502115 RepID=A0AAE3KXE9_9EURY|nr:flagellin [Methanolobus chelungpuianus]MCQ6962752.1 flagellar protein G [Methanolobus chelungpuianus]
MKSRHISRNDSFCRCQRAETAITHMIFFIAAMILAMGVITVLSADVQSIVSSSSANSKLVAQQMRTDITIVNDPLMVPYDSSGNTYTFYAKNTGRTELTPDFITVLVDGILVEPDNMEVEILDGDVVWRPGDILVLHVIPSPSPLGSGDHRILVAAENGKSGSMSFRT